MQVICGVLVMFTGAALGPVHAICRFNQNLRCYGTLGETLHLELDPEDEIILKKDNIKILGYKKQSITTNYLDQARWQFIADNRTIIITRTEKRDAGRYMLDTFDANGTNKGKRHLHLNIEAAVSSVVVKDNCFSSERRTVSCSSEGEQLHFNWTFSGTRITHQLDDGTKTLLLEKEYDGNVTCHVKNHVSHGQSSILLHQCTAVRNMVFLCVWVLEIITLLSVLGGFHIYIKINSKQNTVEGKEQQMVEAL
ncbi:uncharacterized protein LOC118242400 [Electrophorus electricus]|uniref:uncharacterized protein LOC118242400 n=1 Tax=Electrophorus electricus TaxID=8005 RepID=UPI0015D033D4|nr:uncharacterized protein LOC118242400 [Electrophorus electricus]